MVRTIDAICRVILLSMVSALLFVTLSVWTPPVQAEDSLSRPGFQFSCDNPESIQALKALYLCQSKPEFSGCGSLAGYVADRPLPAKAIEEAKALIKQSAGAKLEMPQESGVISSVKAMDQGTFSLDAEDLLFMAIPAVGWGGMAAKTAAKGAQQLGIKMIHRTACSQRTEAFVNSDAAHKCAANPNSINKNTFEFLNSTEDNRKEGMSLPKVCEHYRKRLEALIRRSSYTDLKCGSGELTSVVGKGEKQITRRMVYNSSGALSSVEIRFAPKQSKYIKVFFREDRALGYKAGSDDFNEESGVRTLMAPIRALPINDPVYSELSRLKTEKNEFVSCCQQQDPKLRQQCSAQLGGAPAPASSTEPLVGEGIH